MNLRKVSETQIIIAIAVMVVISIILVVVGIERELSHVVQRVSFHAPSTQIDTNSEAYQIAQEAAVRVADAVAHAPQAWESKNGKDISVNLCDNQGNCFAVINKVIKVVPNHELGCTLISWVSQDGHTNEFHAWACRVITTLPLP